MIILYVYFSNDDYIQSKYEYLFVVLIFSITFADDLNHTYMEVKTIIKQKGFTMEGVAKKMGITRVTLAQNLSRNPTIGTLQKIADVIGCKVGDFFIDEVDGNYNELTALIHYKGDFYKATTIAELEKIVAEIKEK